MSPLLSWNRCTSKSWRIHKSRMFCQFILCLSMMEAARSQYPDPLWDYYHPGSGDSFVNETDYIQDYGVSSIHPFFPGGDSTGLHPCEVDTTDMTCPSDEFATAGRCDFKLECQFCEDELNCTDNPLFPTVFQCDSTCIIFGDFCPPDDGCTRFCDGYEQCPNGDDEPYEMYGFKCPVNQVFRKPELRPKRCTIAQEYIERWKDPATREKYHKHAICPGAADVCYANNSGYLNISKCFQCLDGTIISAVQVCDSQIDCKDLSDECLCSFNKTIPKELKMERFCNMQNKIREQDPDCSGKIACGQERNYTCVEPDKLCNDENPECHFDICHNAKNSTDSFYCYSASGYHVTATLCDGRPECPDREDECNPKCPDHYKFCNLSIPAQKLIGCDVINEPECDKRDQRAFICNGMQDCKNGMDEDSCPKLSRCNPGDPSKNNSYDYEYERCDFIMDCQDTGEDEAKCPHRFYCNDNMPPGLPDSRVKDGKIDCKDGEDECEYKENSFASGQHMIKYKVILVLMWIMAAVALAGNSLVIFNCAKDLWETYRRGATVTVRGRVGVCNKTLVLNLALADFLMGVYLLILVIKAQQYSDEYCKYWQEWRTSPLCSGLGALAVLSSQTSVLIMVMMTTYRFYSVRSPFRAERLKARYLVAVVIACWVPPAFVAVCPLVGYDRAFAFLSRSKLRFFDNAVLGKPEFQDFVQRSWLMSNFSSSDFGPQGWPDLFQKFCKLYPKVCSSNEDNQIVEKWFGYYSADSVCLPRLFPHYNDSGWDYTAGVIAFDFVSFIYILLVYTMLYVCTVRRSNEPGNGLSFGRGSSFASVDELRSREDRVIWQRISRLLFTDFVCWMPICITCLISLSGSNIPPLMYQISAAFFLPINSALNPLLYSNAIYRAIDRFFPVWLQCDGVPYVNCGRATTNGNHTSNGERANGTPASATDELRISRDQLALETRSITVSETDRARVSNNPEVKPFMSNGRLRLESGSDNAFQPDSPPAASGRIVRSMARMSRFFSERKKDNQHPPVYETAATLPRRHRPKSQSTTSTSTTFTSIGQDSH
ncbi:uncharacterized protein LOC120337813 [Styela clava]